MNKKGFTLVELLAVIAILAVVISLGTISVMGISNSIKKGMVETKVKSIETTAIEYGQERMEEFTEKCTIDGVDYNFCMAPITVRDLVVDGIFETKERDSENNLTVINNSTGESMMEEKVQIYKKNNRVYALFLGDTNARNEYLKK